MTNKSVFKSKQTKQMKKYITYLLTVLIIGAYLTSCHEDNSTLDIHKIQGIEVDTTGISSLEVLQFETLTVNPLINSEGLLESDISYEWHINLGPDDADYELIGTEKKLNYVVIFSPTNEGDFHQINLTVTDKITDLKYITSWELVIKNSIGEGLVVAHTADGVNTDISHIMAPEVTTDYSDISVKHHIYTSVNRMPIEGLVKQMRFTNINRKQSIMAITDNSVMTINTLDYSFAGKNDDLFVVGKSNYNPKFLSGTKQSDFYVSDNKFYLTWLAIYPQFGLPKDTNISFPDVLAVDKRDNVATLMGFYDEVNEQFVHMACKYCYPSYSLAALAADPLGVFNPVTVTNKENVAAVASNSGEFKFVLKDKATGNYELYGTTSAGPKTYVDLADAPEIENANHFVILDNQKVLLYATDTKIYAVLYSTDTPIFQQRYTTPAGESITTLQVYQQSDYPWSSTYIDTNNQQLIMSTYNNTEGKVYLLPMVNTGLANIDKTNIKIFTGFDLITAITTQK